MSFQNILVTANNKVTTITVNRPDKLNALNAATIDELGAALDAAYTDTETRVIIITGAGEKAFVAGADISQFNTLNVSEGAALARAGQEKVFDKIENMTKPVIAAVNGFALGGGCELAMACHMRVASDTAKFGQPEVKLGLIPGYGGTQRLTKLVGKGKAIELLCTADMIGAQEALALGLVNHVTTPAELLNKCIEIANKIIAQAPLAVGACITCANAATDNPANGYTLEIDEFGKCFGTADMKEGVGAFLEKRKAVFKGE
ncbi:MAG: enoyl-CoA hydratase/isomerase family protein [Bacteroidetes bacterium]|nr:enoyl-CoA hydratase/isomerase family protein [Bacteroidota bacterium]